MLQLREKDVKAIKEHKCNYCNRIVEKGEVYNNSTNVHDGRIYDWKGHLDCMELANELKMYDDCDEGVTSEDFMEYVNEYYNRISDVKTDWYQKLIQVKKHYLKNETIKKRTS
jgi:hypothetical protein